MTELAALVDALPLSVLLVSERYLTAGSSWSLLLGARQQASMIAPILQRRGRVHTRHIVSMCVPRLLIGVDVNLSLSLTSLG